MFATLLVAVVVAAAALYVLAPRLRRKVTAVTTTGPGPAPPDHFRDTEPGRRLRDYLRDAYTAGDEAERRIKEGGEVLRRNAPEVVEEISHVYNSAPEGDYNLRWSLTYCAARLEHPAALVFLNSVVWQPIPPERSRDIHHHSTVSEETAVRLRAVEGVERLARRGDESARGFLFDYLRSPSFSLRVAATRALLDLPDGEGLRARITEALPRGEDFILDIRRVDPRDAMLVPPPLMRRAGRGPVKPSRSERDFTSGVRREDGARATRKGPPSARPTTGGDDRG